MPVGRRQPEHVLGSPVVGGSVGADRQARRSAHDVHQIRARRRASSARSRRGRTSPGCSSPPPAARWRGPADTSTDSSSIGACAGDAVDRLGEQQEVLGHGRDLLQAVGVALDRAVLGVERLPQHRPAAVDVAHRYLSSMRTSL